MLSLKWGQRQLCALTQRTATARTAGEPASSRSYRASSSAQSTATRITPLVPKPEPTFPSSFTVPVVNLATGETTGTVDLLPKIFGAKTKGRGEVAGSTRKIFRQKGTGNARAGAVRAPQRKGSGAAHGPHPKSWKFKVNKNVRKLAMASALSAKFAQGNLLVVEGLEAVGPKTKAVAEVSEKYNWEEGGALIIGGATKPENFEQASRNIHYIEVRPQQGLNVYSVLRRKHLVIAKDALPEIVNQVPL